MYAKNRILFLILLHKLAWNVKPTQWELFATTGLKIYDEFEKGLTQETRAEFNIVLRKGLNSYTNYWLKYFWRK